MNTIAAKWQSFEDSVIPKDAQDIQRQEMKRAFYAGAGAFGSLTYACSHPDVSEAAGVMMLEGLHQELEQFMAEISTGKA